ncbi:hypothetical protein L209DRAFT_524836 [Thermothelomyces heterothallicus CBS 203.75]
MECSTILFAASGCLEPDHRQGMEHIKPATLLPSPSPWTRPHHQGDGCPSASALTRLIWVISMVVASVVRLGYSGSRRCSVIGDGRHGLAAYGLETAEVKDGHPNN